MAYKVIEEWFRSRKYAQLNGSRMRPIEHPVLKDAVLSIQKGQAESICLLSENGSRWILKKFHKGKNLDRNYLVSVSSLLPKHNAFKAGTDRQILSSDKLTNIAQCYYDSDLAVFLDNTILMPQIIGIDWAGLADEIRQGNIQISKAHKVELARNLTELIDLLEKNNCCHRDFSSGNIFISTTTWQIYLIDFESFYHPKLKMPKATTCGTTGYTAPFAWQSGTLDAKQSWCLYADRYALALLIVEFLVLDKGFPLTAEGGMFDQDELCTRSGTGLDQTIRTLEKDWPTVTNLFKKAINSKGFNSCPSPQDWRQMLESIPGVFVRPPKLGQLEKISADYFRKIIGMSRRPAPLWPAPCLADIPEFDLESSLKSVSNIVTLPSNPWN